MKILLFGATGFIGKHLVKRLLDEGYQVTGVSTKPAESSSFSSSFYKHVLLDITKKKEFSKLYGDFDCVFNTAAYIPKIFDTRDAKRCLVVNGIGTLNILDFISKNKSALFVHSSSASVYGFQKKLPVIEESQLYPKNAYAISKLTGEYFCNIYKSQHNIKMTILRYSSVYGPGCNQYTVLPLFFERARHNKPIMLYDKGFRSQDFVYVDDVVEANLLALKKRREGVFNIGGGVDIPMKVLAKDIANFYPNVSIHYDRSKKENDRFVLDIKKAKKEIGYIPKISLEKGLKLYRASL